MTTVILQLFAIMGVALVTFAIVLYVAHWVRGGK